MTIIQKAILAKYPDYDFERYTFKSGDVVKTRDGATILVKESGLVWVHAYLLKRSLKYREYKLLEIPYVDLPYYKEGEYTRPPYKINKSICWHVGDIVRDCTTDFVVYLYEECGHQEFYGYVLECDNKHYEQTGIYIPNPHRDYIAV